MPLHVAVLHAARSLKLSEFRFALDGQVLSHGALGTNDRNVIAPPIIRRGTSLRGREKRKAGNFLSFDGSTHPSSDPIRFVDDYFSSSAKISSCSRFVTNYKSLNLLSGIKQRRSLFRNQRSLRFRDFNSRDPSSLRNLCFLVTTTRVVKMVRKNSKQNISIPL